MNNSNNNGCDCIIIIVLIILAISLCSRVKRLEEKTDTLEKIEITK